ncbi:bursicon-like [Varroa jacobsoni]|uniref:bursicon-like n=1 Tax=Varroa jacobsoni TaxID=62625 RepID=UPI000BFA61E5|nr:bursicon-like [Varroa jacobsoni]
MLSERMWPDHLRHYDCRIDAVKATTINVNKHRSRVQPKLRSPVLSPFIFLVLLHSLFLNGAEIRAEENCQLKPVIHIIKEPGCQPKPVPSFACHGACASYVQVSGSKYWQVERSCMCCQEVGEREATRRVYCPNQAPKYKKVVTRAPVECMCRPCSSPNEEEIVAQELVAGLASK